MVPKPILQPLLGGIGRTNAISAATMSMYYRRMLMIKLEIGLVFVLALN